MLAENKKGRIIWSGCACAIDGYVEEVHTYEEAENADFHHSLYFSIEAAERINNEESVFFWIEKGRIETMWRNGEFDKTGRILESLKEQGIRIQ